VIEKLKLKFGRTPSATADAINLSPITVFVGPNNSGKSKVLREIYDFCQSGRLNSSHNIIAEIKFSSQDQVAAQAIVDRVRLPPNKNEAVQLNHILVGKRGQRMQVPSQQLAASIQNPDSQPHHYCQWFLSYNTLMLDGVSRITHINQQSAGDLQEQPHSSFQVLFRDKEKRKEVRRIIFDAFEKYFCIDFTHIGNLKIRLSKRPPQSDIEELGLLSEDAQKFYSEAELIDHTSDGVKAFTGMITEVVAGDPEVILIDEPEAFLHPSLAFKLGVEISKASLSAKKRVFASTHSPKFVMGCIQSNAPLNIIRLTYRDGIATSRILPSEKVIELMRNPHLRSTGVIDALFYEFVIITEADADRAFYQEINERLLRYKPEWGIPNCLFINAQNKQGVKTIMKPLRELGIPAVGLVDIDFVKDGGAVWTDWMSSAYIPQITADALGNMRAEIKRKFEATSHDMKRHGGVEILEGAEKEGANNFLDQLEEYGIFVVRGGEVEDSRSYRFDSGREHHR
jgi:ABC-type cobalamin/Fe3+-siderophores transport system ATPase subunit